MALNDLTGQNIQDTYQKVVQTDGANIADGTGSALPIKFDGPDLIVSGALRAQSYIVSESIVNVSSGSTAFGDSADDSHTFTGNITASGNISASGTIEVGDSITVKSPDYIQIQLDQTDSGKATLGVASGTSEVALISTTNNASYDADIKFVTNDGSGNTEVVRFKEDGKVGIGTNNPSEKLHLYGNSNADVKFKIENDFSGKNANLILDSGLNGDDVIVFNENGTTRGLIIYDGGLDLLKITNDGSSGTEHLAMDTSGNVGINTFSPGEKLEVVGNISASGTITALSSNIVTIDGGSF